MIQRLLLLLVLPVVLFALDPKEMLAQNPSLLLELQNNPALKNRLQSELGSGNGSRHLPEYKEAENNITTAPRNIRTDRRIAEPVDETISKEESLQDLSPFTYKPGSKRLDEILNEQVRQETQELERFGSRFLNNHNTLNPSALPVPGNYLINVGDGFRIALYGQTDKEFSAAVNHNGDLMLPDIGPVKVAGIAFADVKKKLTDILESAYSNTSAYVDLDTFSTIQVTVTGQVAAPGIYNLQSFSTALDALKAAEGILPTGSMRDILIKRGGKIIAHFDLYGLIRYGESRNNPFLRYGDVVIIPTVMDDITLTGAVRTPALYELKPAESLQQLLEFAGGVTAEAKQFGIKIKRYDTNRHIRILTLNLKEAATFDLQKGDRVFIRPITERESIAVKLLGNVVAPGARTLTSESTLNTLLAQELKDNGPRGLFLDNTAMHYGAIKRYNGGLDFKLVSFDLASVLAGEKSVPLHDNDEIYIFNRHTLKENPYIYVQGDALEEPVKLQFFHHMTLSDVYHNVVFRSEGSKEVNLSDSSMMHQGETARSEESWHSKTLQSAAEKENGNASPANRSQDYRESSALRYRVYPDITHIKVDRQTAEGRRAYVINLETAPAFELIPFDEVTIMDYYSTHPLQTVTISGEVILPDTYAYEPGLTLKKLISVGGGFTEKSYRDAAEIVRYSVIGGERKREVLKVSLGESDGSNIELTPYDEVTIFPIPNWNTRETVTLSGEVRFPGIYVIERGEKLASIIERAGGFTEDAFLEGALFTRSAIKEQQKEQLMQQVKRLQQKAVYISQSADKFGELTDQKQNVLMFTNQLAKDAQEFVPLGRISVSLERDLKKLAASTSNIILKPGDSLNIPTQNDTIFVFGEVLNASTIVYDPELSVEAYIERAGGLNEMADAGAIYIIRADGTSVRYSSDLFGAPNVYVKKGDTIVVPMKLDFISGWQMVKDAAQVLYQIGLAAAAFHTVSQ